MIIQKKCKKCGEIFDTIDKFSDEVCEKCWDKSIGEKKNDVKICVYYKL